MNESLRWKHLLVAVLGAVVGGVLGYYATCWLMHQGLYALALPGGLLGLGAGLLVKDRSVVRAVVCGAAAVGLGLFTDWHLEPFIADDSLGYYLRHVYQLHPITWVMVALGGACGAWLSVGREQPMLHPSPGPPPPKAGAV